MANIGTGALHQRTLKNSIHCSGIGLHSGVKVNMTLHPAAPDSGILFRRNDTPCFSPAVSMADYRSDRIGPER